MKIAHNLNPVAIKIGLLEQIKFEISGDTSFMEVQNGTLKS